MTTSIGFVVGIIFLRSLGNSAEEDKGEGYRDQKSIKKQRDKAILDLKKGMDTLVQSLRENGNNNMKRLKSGSQSARGSPRPALAGRRLSPRPPGAQTARSHTDGKMLLLPYKPGEFGRSPVSEIPWGARPRRSKKSKKTETIMAVGNNSGILLTCVIPNGIRGPVHWVFL